MKFTARLLVIIFLTPLAILCDLLDLFIRVPDKGLFNDLARYNNIRNGSYTLPWADDDKFWRTYVLWSVLK